MTGPELAVRHNYQVCSPTLYKYLLKYSDLHLEYFWRTSCYMYPPQNGQY